MFTSLVMAIMYPEDEYDDADMGISMPEVILFIILAVVVLVNWD